MCYRGELDDGGAEKVTYGGGGGLDEVHRAKRGYGDG